MIFDKMYIQTQGRVNIDTTNPPLAFMTPYEDNAAFEKRRKTVDNWGKSPDGASSVGPFIIDNKLIKGFHFGSAIVRWNTGNKWVRIKDPRGFELEIPIENLVNLLATTTTISGEIQDECVWFREGSQNYLVKYDPKQIEAQNEFKFGPGVVFKVGKNILKYVGVRYMTLIEATNKQIILEHTNDPFTDNRYEKAFAKRMYYVRVTTSKVHVCLDVYGKAVYYKQIPKKVSPTTETIEHTIENNTWTCKVDSSMADYSSTKMAALFQDEDIPLDISVDKMKEIVKSYHTVNKYTSKESFFVWNSDVVFDPITHPIAPIMNTEKQLRRNEIYREYIMKCYPNALR